MYNRLENLLLEGLSGASRAFLRLNKHKRHLIRKEHKRRKEDQEANGPLYTAYGVEMEPIMAKRFEDGNKFYKEIAKVKAKQSNLKKAIPRRINRENFRMLNYGPTPQIKQELSGVKSYTARAGKQKAKEIRDEVAQRIKAARKNRHL